MAAKKKKVKKAALVDLTKFCLVEVSRLVLASWNYRSDDPEMTTKLVANLKRNGQVEAIQVRELKGKKLEVVNGNHRVEAFREIGLKKVVAYNLGKVSILDAKRLAIELNETRFKADHIQMAEILAELAKTYSLDDLEATMPFSGQDLADYIKLLDFDLSKYQSDELPPIDDPADKKKGTLMLALTEDDWKAWRRIKKSLLGVAVTDLEVFRLLLQAFKKRLKKKKKA